MRVFLAGASGAIGRRLVPLLVSTGHQVTGTTTTPAKIDQLTRLGADAVQLDLLDAAATRRAVAGAPHLDSDAPAGLVAGRDAMRSLHDAVLERGGVVLSYGGFYGPGTSLSRDGEQTAMIRRRLLPIIGSGDTIVQFLHIDDAATATLAALTRGVGHYDVVDDEPVALREWVPAMAAMLGAKPPRHLPVWLAKLVGGDGVALMTVEAPATSNARAKADLRWKPVYPSWREGLALELS
jgi:nucleoside-diphosphate-sugar epimerase